MLLREYFAALLDDGILQFRNSGNLRDYVLKENALNMSLTQVWIKIM
jgi:hypothetical protein